MRPGRLKDRERHGTGDKDEKSVNGTQISFGKFPGHRENRTTFSGIPFIPEKIPIEQTKKSFSIYIPIGIPGSFGRWKNARSQLTIVRMTGSSFLCINAGKITYFLLATYFSFGKSCTRPIYIDCSKYPNKHRSRLIVFC